MQKFYVCKMAIQHNFFNSRSRGHLKLNQGLYIHFYIQQGTIVLIWTSAISNECIELMKEVSYQKCI